jgi:translocation and assembly module TamA
MPYFYIHKLHIIHLLLSFLVVFFTFSQSANASVDYTRDDDNAYIFESKAEFSSLRKDIKYEIHGIKGINKQNVISYLASAPKIKKAYFRKKQEEIREIVKEALKPFGYYSPKINFKFKKKTSNVLHLYINLGKPMYVREVDVAVLGEAVTDPWFMMLFREYTFETYSLFSHEKYTSLKENMITRAINNGYLDAHFVSSVVFTNTTDNYADIHLVLNSGKRYLFGDINYKGDVQYKELVDDIIVVKANEVFSSRRIYESSSNLYNTGFFDIAEIKVKHDEIQNYKVPVDVTLQRKKDNIVEFSIGYSTDEKVRGRISWEKPLLNTSGHSLLLQGSVSFDELEALARYKIPRNNPIKEYDYFEIHQTYSNLNDLNSKILGGKIASATKVNHGASIDYLISSQYEDYTIGKESGNTLINGVGVDLNFADITAFIDPRYGYRFTGKVFGANQLFGSEVNFLQLKGIFRYLTSPTPNTRLAVGSDLGINFSDEYRKIPPYYRFFTGGDTTIRGFSYRTVAARDQGFIIGGRFLISGTAEFQHPIPFYSGNDIRQNWFVDAGMAPNNVHTEKVSVGVGTGVRYITKIGIIKADLAFGVSEVHIPVRVHIGIGVDL